ncbi:MAG TPA: ABC transporter ATP-binding protein [Phycisphaerae bacterium]|nr:ABC transporter ATP-binding protein [Phycisphaerae bacterium]HPS52791.1 ABC transporter ATP-binding protein [Phycisphaerae bacterium]
MTDNSDILLSVSDLRTYFRTDDGVVPAVDGVSFDIRRGETFALVGESGCGKSVTSYSILKLLQYPPAYHPTGRITFNGEILLDAATCGGKTEKQMRRFRGNKIGMIFQEPMTSLNPVFTVGQQIVEAIRLHKDIRNSQARRLAAELLDQVGLPQPAKSLDAYPHQLSGGMRQRVMIAMALACDPELLIADEPTTALDVTIQAQILELLAEIQSRRDLAILLITHDLAVVAETAHTVAVMYASKIVEKADVYNLFDEPLHPYTQGLLRAVPKLGQTTDRLEQIPGNVPDPIDFPAGCYFNPRCPKAAECCRQGQNPQLIEVRPGHLVACHCVTGK